MPEKDTLNVSHFSEVVISPWIEDLDNIVIDCEYYNDLANIWFQDIIELQILSLHFSSCKLQYGYEIGSKTERSVYITKSVFKKGTIDIRSTESHLYVASCYQLYFFIV